MKRGRGGRPLLESEILAAQDKSKSAAEAARRLDVSYNTYRKYAKLYDIFERLKNPAGFGIRKAYNIKTGKYALDQIMAGAWPNYPVKKFQARLIRNCYLEEKCNQCDFKEERVSDFKIPLLLDFIDGVESHKQLENLRLLCYNCYFLMVGNVR